MGFFLIEAIFDKINKKLFLFLALFFPICLHGLYNLILSSNNFSTYWIYILLIVFIIRAYFVFKKERNLQKYQKVGGKEDLKHMIIFITSQKKII